MDPRSQRRRCLSRRGVAEAVLGVSSVPVTLVRPGDEHAAAQRVLLQSEDCESVLAAASSLSAMGATLTQADLARLRSCVDSLPENLRMKAAETYLSLLAGKTAITAAVAFLRDGDALEREAASAFLGAADEDAIPAIISVLDSPDLDRQWVAYRIISEIGGPSAIDPLARGLQSEDLSIRWVASDGLLGFGNRVLVPVLEALAYRPLPSRSTTPHGASSSV